MLMWKVRHRSRLSWKIARSWRGGSKAPLAAVAVGEIGRYEKTVRGVVVSGRNNHCVAM